MKTDLKILASKIRVMLPQTMEPWGPLPAGRGKEAFSPRAFGGSTALSNSDF